MSTEAGCPIGNPSAAGKQQLATAKVAERSKEHARSPDGHRE